MNLLGESSMPDTLANIRTELATLGTKLDLLIARIDPVITDHETRLRKLEAKIWVASGFALAGGGVLGAVLGPVLGGGP